MANTHMRPRPYKFPIGISRFRRDARAARSVDKDHPVKEEEEVHGSRAVAAVGGCGISLARQATSYPHYDSKFSVEGFEFLDADAICASCIVRKAVYPPILISCTLSFRLFVFVAVSATAQSHHNARK